MQPATVQWNAGMALTSGVGSIGPQLIPFECLLTFNLPWFATFMITLRKK